MPKVSWSDDGKTIDIDCDGEMPLNSSSLNRFGGSLTGFADLIGLQKLDVTYDPDSYDIPVWDVSWKAVDGRSWSQGIRFVDGVREDGYFTVDKPGDGPNDAWLSIDELVHWRTCRETLAPMLVNYGITRVKVRW